MPPSNLVWHFPIIIRLKNHNPLTCIINKKIYPYFNFCLSYSSLKILIQNSMCYSLENAWESSLKTIQIKSWVFCIKHWHLEIKFHECFHVLGNFHVQIERFVRKPFPSNDMQIKHVEDCTSSYCTYIYTWNQLIRKWPIRG